MDAILTELEKPFASRTSVVAPLDPTQASPSGIQGAPSLALSDASLAQTQQQSELRRSGRPCACSSRAKEGGYDAKLALDKQRAARARRTRTRNKKGKSSYAHSDAESTGAGSSTFASETDNDGRDSIGSPTPSGTAGGSEAQPTHSVLKERLSHKFQQVVENSGTQTLIEVDAAISSDPVYATQSQEQSAETQFLSPVALDSGGGFHLNHPTHHKLRPGNNTTYRMSSGRRTIPTSRPDGTEPDPPSPGNPTELGGVLDDHAPAPIFVNSQEHANSPQTARTPAPPFLGYPSGHESRHSHGPVGSNHNSPARSPTSVRSLNPDVNLPPSAEGSLTHISTGSKSLGDPIPTPQRLSHTCAASQLPSASQQSNHSQPLQPDRGSTPDSAALDSTPSEQGERTQPNTPTQSRGKRPLAAPSTPRPSKRLATTICSTTSGKAYGTRLNIVEINSKCISTAGPRSRQASHQHSAPSQNWKEPRSNTGATGSVARNSWGTSNDDFELLDGLDVDQFVVDSALNGVLVQKPGYRKPTAHDLPGMERALWREVRDLAWAFSMGQGNFQTRAMFATWAHACYIVVIKRKLPNWDTTTATMSDDMLTILNNLCNARYQDLNRLRKIVQEYFQLKNPSTEDEREETEFKIQEMYPDFFHYQNRDELVDPYEGYILYLALESVFFYGPKAISARYPALFHRSKSPKDEQKHLAVLAYLATLVQFCLGEWSEGFFQKDSLNATKQYNVWLCHFDGLKNVHLVARKRLIDTYNEWVTKSYNASQAARRFTKKRYVQAVIRTKDVCPDSQSRSPSPADED